MDLSKTIKVRFQIKCQETKWGEILCLLGDNLSLANWNPKKAIKMNTDKSTFPIWFSDKIEIIPQNNILEYKYLIMNESGKIIRWEDFPNNRKIDFLELPVNYSKEEILELDIKDVYFGKSPLNNNSVNINLKF